MPPSQFSVRGGQLFAGVDGQPERIFDTDRSTWQPRVGLAYRLDSKTAIRTGFGLFTSKTIDRGGQLGFSLDTPYVSSTDGGRTPANSLANPFPQGFLSPTGSARGLATSLGQQPRWDDPTRRLPFSIQSSFHVQRELPGSWLVEAGYSYNKSKRLALNVPSNQVALDGFLELGRPRYDASGALLAQPFRLEDRVANPFFGLPQFAGTALGTGSTTSVLQLMSAFPQFTAFNRGLVDAGRSSYHGLQLKVEKRFSDTLSLIVSHTWSKQLDYTTYLTILPNLAYDIDHSLNPDDRTHYFSAGSSWELPFGRGRKYATGASGITNAVIGGWQLAGFYTLQSGRPVSFGGTNLTWNGQDASLPRGERSLDRWFRTEQFGPIPKQNTYALRTTPTTFSTIRASRQNNIDLAIFKNFKVTEKMKFSAARRIVQCLQPRTIRRSCDKSHQCWLRDCREVAAQPAPYHSGGSKGKLLTAMKVNRRSFVSSGAMALAGSQPASGQARPGRELRVAACQILTFPDVRKSAEKISAWMEKAAADKVDVALFPEAGSVRLHSRRRLLEGRQSA